MDRDAGEYVGAVDYSSDEAYFEDVSESDEYYSYIQSSVEWGIIEAEKKFNGNDAATGEFASVSAIKSVGEAKLRMCLGVDESWEDADYQKLAIDNGLIREEQLEGGLSEKEAEDMIERLDELYYGVFWPQDLEEYEFQEAVIEVNQDAVLSYDREANVLGCTESLRVGDVITFKNGGFVVARKIWNILNDGTYELEDPELEEVFVTLRQSGVAGITFQDIVNYYGEENLKLADRAGDRNSTAMMASLRLSDDFESNGFKIEAEEEDGKCNITITSNDTGISYQLPISPEVSEEYEDFNACLDISKIFVGAQVDLSLSGVDYSNVALDMESNVSTKLASADEVSDRLLLFETPVPIGNGIVGVGIQIYLVTTLNGEIYLEADIPFMSDVYYEKGKGIRNRKCNFSVKDSRIEASAELVQKVEVAPILVVGQLKPVIDAELGVGVSTTAKISAHDDGQICADVNCAFPVVSLSVGQSDVLYHGKESIIASIGLSGSWDIIDSDHAPKKIPLHFEVLSDKTKQFVTECTYGKEESAGKEDPMPGLGNDPVRLALEQYRRIVSQAGTYDYGSTDASGVYRYALVRMDPGYAVPALLLAQDDTFGTSAILLFQYDVGSKTVIQAVSTMTEGVYGSYRGSLSAAGDGKGLLSEEFSSGNGQGTVSRVTLDGDALRSEIIFEGFLFDDTNDPIKGIGAIKIEWHDVSDTSALDSWTPDATPPASAPVEPGPSAEPSVPAMDGDRVVFTGTLGFYSYDEVLALQGVPDPNPQNDHQSENFWLVVLDTPQSVELRKPDGDGSRMGQVSMINVTGVDGIERYDGQRLSVSIDPANTWWPGDTSIPWDQPITSDVRILP